jgi:hypothetical protein
MIRDEYFVVTGKTIPANRAVDAIFGFFRREVTAKSGRSAPSGFSGLCGQTRAEASCNAASRLAHFHDSVTRWRKP